jgi:hypothetical protein
MGLIDETYRYLYDTAAYYGTGVEYLIGGIVLGALIVLWVLVRLVRGKKEREIVVKVIKEEKPQAPPGGPEAVEEFGGITISPGEVTIRAEGKTTRLPRDRVMVDIRGGKLEIKVVEPEEKPTPEAVVEEAPPEEVAPEEPRTLGAALKNVARKHSLDSVTLITADGLLVDSISKTPEDDAEAASELLSEMELGEETVVKAVEEEEESRYLFAVPFEKTHGVFLIRSKDKISSENLSAIQEGLESALKLLLR